ncbi:MAG: tRNA (N(6)-L-threonylcarbamoyladenosine(37)-C(2))-methylthiotransferase [Candidatus Woesearchaeota archaeon]
MRIRIVTFGCSSNVAEGEMMAGLLAKAGHKIVNSNEDLLIVNICSVKAPSFNKGLKEIRKAKTKVIAAGCIPSSALDRIFEIKPDASVVNTHNLSKIAEVAERAGEIIVLMGKDAQVKTCIPRLRKNNLIAIIPICSGCLGSCAYCSVRLIKGDLLSFPQEQIVEEAEQAIKEGCKELWITAQDTGAYGKDISTDITELLSQLLTIKGDFKIRLGMANPQYIKPLLPKLIPLLKSKKMFRFLHIPVQSGNNRILKLMKRKYNIKGYKEIIKELKKVPGITIATDIIVGFPTETKKEYEDSLKLIKETKPDVLNISRYYPQPGTEGKAMKPVDTKEVKRRSAEISKEFSEIALQNNRKWVGWKGEIIIDEKAKTWMGRNQSYKPVAVSEEFRLGEKINVEIKKATKNCLLASRIL